MKSKLFVIKDKKSEFGNIFEMPNEGAAVRDFGQNVMRPAPDGRINMMAEYPDDFCLAVIGEYDHEKGKIVAYDEPKIIAEANQYAVKKEK